MNAAHALLTGLRLAKEGPMKTPSSSRDQRNRTMRAVSLAIGMSCGFLAGLPVLADDTELFVVDSSQFPEARANVLLIIDNSQSMESKISTQPVFNHNVAYPGDCDTDRVYWKQYREPTLRERIRRIDPNTPPECDSDSYWFSRNMLACDAALQAFQ